MTHPPTRTALLALLAAVAGCATARRPASAAPAAAEAPPAAASAPGPAAPAATEAPRYAVEPAATLLVLASGRAFLLLGAAPIAGSQGEPELSLSYLAASDPAPPADPGAAARLASAAQALFEAFRSQAEADGHRAVTVSAVFGRTGAPGTVAHLRFTRQGARWEQGALEQLAAARLPPLPLEVERAAEAERAGAAAAEKFVDDVDHVEIDAAWAATSAVVKAVTSRATFENQLLDLVARRGVAKGRHPLFYRYVASARAPIPGSEMLVRFESQVEAGRVVEEVRLRLDDDQEWRVAGLGFGRT
ncbi:DUF4019 domain-containing protein [Anaeromyxobacter paludicola]|uniref:Lipoprotein n=1 Tax=Anaeromyxobacter paludicola TaxID=2918171 RepID=A0ABM7XDN9_9BACT|nr:DUF4019 domain-containing protein [Anaeromyxobacter paludicola]BDG09996.1 hypothetical protein AMPC_31090 [Anaeromyxobacter paludicola]